MAHLIFIEGVSGVGKSTISLALREALPSARCFLEGDSDSPLDLFHVSYLTRAQHALLLRAHPASAGALNKRSVIEADYALIRYRNAAREPLFPPELQQYLEARELCYRAQNPPPLPEYEKVFLNLWRQFAQREKLGIPHVIFDGALLHHQINDLMRNYDAGGKK
jgi:deoxyadenosine/deoxycytidine kinase